MRISGTFQCKYMAHSHANKWHLSMCALQQSLLPCASPSTTRILTAHKTCSKCQISAHDVPFAPSCRFKTTFRLPELPELRTFTVTVEPTWPSRSSWEILDESTGVCTCVMSMSHTCMRVCIAYIAWVIVIHATRYVDFGVYVIMYANTDTMYMHTIRTMICGRKLWIC